MFQLVFASLNIFHELANPHPCLCQGDIEGQQVGVRLVVVEAAK